jgi:hypothetical protein
MSVLLHINNNHTAWLSNEPVTKVTSIWLSNRIATCKQEWPTELWKQSEKNISPHVIILRNEGGEMTFNVKWISKGIPGGGDAFEEQKRSCISRRRVRGTRGELINSTEEIPS